MNGVQKMNGKKKGPDTRLLYCHYKTRAKKEVKQRAHTHTCRESRAPALPTAAPGVVPCWSTRRPRRSCGARCVRQSRRVVQSSRETTTTTRTFEAPFFQSRCRRRRRRPGESPQPPAAAGLVDALVWALEKWARFSVEDARCD